ncbi:type IV secretion system lytic transglycosylase VirB1 [uncultured Caudovirales phage]|uniref:Type IV secretion system lytic transglycosylase VirB1 n=1 Tax=uncultured Caudovirales phage TaxID=2100421 RepID=A0A6J5RM96_9CAUD|nr:type IV secretion system lytic transglycosylase VirB1 [uncultured Caudovirales phage]
MGAVILTAATLVGLVGACAPAVANSTMLAVVQVESRGDPLAIYVNKSTVQPRPAATVESAAATVRRYVATGHTVDMGLAGINTRTAARLGLSIEQSFDPCANVAAGAAVLAEGYDRGVAEHGEGQRALRAALSAYNTGSLTHGMENGYVDRYGPWKEEGETKPPAQPAPAADLTTAADLYAADVRAALAER